MLIVLYTDGSSRGNPGPGGYGAILTAGEHYKELAAGFRETTNNRMELLAVIIGLESLKQPGQKVKVVSDSKYVIDSVEKKWVFGWEKKSYKDKKNPDLWKRFLRIYRQHDVSFQWVKGHAGHPLNERADVLAYTAASGKELYIDEVFEAGRAG